MSINAFTCKIPIHGSNSDCILNTEWQISEINFLLLHDNQAWSGRFQLIGNEDITELMDQLSLPRDAYVEELRKALTTQDGADSFTYTLENEKFIWKKNVRRNISVKFGIVNLSNVPLFETFVQVLDWSIQSNKTFYMKLQESNSQREALEKENNILRTKLNEIVGKKNQMEEMLYSQFLHLLNEKKIRIKELKKKIPDRENEDLMESDHFDSDTEIDSDEEEKLKIPNFLGRSIHNKDKNVSPPKRLRQTTPNYSIAGPSGETSKVKNSKTVTQKKPAMKIGVNVKIGKKVQKKPNKDSCVFGQRLEQEQNLSESSDDVFMFQNQPNKITKDPKVVKQSINKIKYESDEETDLDDSKQEVNETDKTYCQIDQVNEFHSSVNHTTLNEGEKSSQNDQLRTINKTMELDTVVVSRTNKNESVKHESRNTSVEDNIKKESKGPTENSEGGKKTSYRGLSSSTLDILNQLI